jgi:hypothetical protein
MTTRRDGPKLRMLKPGLKLIHQYSAKPPSRETAFYKTSEWRALVAQVKAERGERCEDCGATGCCIVGDHVDELADGGARLDKANVRLRCDSCHGKKSAEARCARTGWSLWDR